MTMKTMVLGLVVAAAAMSPLAHREAAAQAAPVTVTGAEIEGWFAADEMAVAGVSKVNKCHWITKGPGTARTQTVYCPNLAPFTITGEARVEGDRLCSKFVYPDGNRFEGCQEIVRVGDNKYEGRVNGVVRNVFYRLIP
jgi:hypothetical protein